MSTRVWMIAVFYTVFPLMACATNLKISTLPEGMCALDARIPEQATILSYLSASAAGGNQLVTSFASCNELEAIAAKKAISISHYGSVLQQAKSDDLTMDRPTYVASVAKSFGAAEALTKAAMGSVAPAATQGANASGMANPSSIAASSKGVLYNDPRMVIIGMEQTNSFGSQITKVASTAGMTMVGGTPVSVNLYAPLSDKDAFTKSVDALKPFINRMLRENQ